MEKTYLTDLPIKPREFFYWNLAKVLSQLNRSIEKAALIHQGKAGEINIGYASSAMHSILPGLLRYMKDELPDLKANLIEGTNQRIFDKIDENRVDFGFVPNAFIPDGLSSLTVYTENYMLILPKEHRIDKANLSSLKDCAEENWILHPKPEGSGYMEEILKIITDHGFHPKIVHRSPNTSSVLRLVEAGLGIAMMGKSTLKGYDTLNIKSIELADLPNQLDMKLVWKTERKRELEPYLNFLRLYLEI
ncbi:MAG: LysR family transcriptional regulator [Balneolaceae bacterium]|nr:LysR family transcriptional regulator [Balneolaceae bacterium]